MISYKDLDGVSYSGQAILNFCIHFISSFPYKINFINKYVGETGNELYARILNHMSRIRNDIQDLIPNPFHNKGHILQYFKVVVFENLKFNNLIYRLIRGVILDKETQHYATYWNLPAQVTREQCSSNKKINSPN